MTRKPRPPTGNGPQPNGNTDNNAATRLDQNTAYLIQHLEHQRRELARKDRRWKPRGPSLNLLFDVGEKLGDVACYLRRVCRDGLGGRPRLTVTAECHTLLNRFENSLLPAGPEHTNVGAVEFKSIQWSLTQLRGVVDTWIGGPEHDRLLASLPKGDEKGAVDTALNDAPPIAALGGLFWFLCRYGDACDKHGTVAVELGGGLCMLVQESAGVQEPVDLAEFKTGAFTIWCCMQLLRVPAKPDEQILLGPADYAKLKAAGDELAVLATDYHALLTEHISDLRKRSKYELSMTPMRNVDKARGHGATQMLQGRFEIEIDKKQGTVKCEAGRPSWDLHLDSDSFRLIWELSGHWGEEIRTRDLQVQIEGGVQNVSKAYARFRKECRDIIHVDPGRLIAHRHGYYKWLPEDISDPGARNTVRRFEVPPV